MPETGRGVPPHVPMPAYWEMDEESNSSRRPIIEYYDVEEMRLVWEVMEYPDRIAFSFLNSVMNAVEGERNYMLNEKLEFQAKIDNYVMETVCLEERTVDLKAEIEFAEKRL